MMGKRMTAERLAQIEADDWWSHGFYEELMQALKAERKTLESLPCYMAWFWNDGEPDPFPDCDCPVCEMKGKSGE